MLKAFNLNIRRTILIEDNSSVWLITQKTFKATFWFTNKHIDQDIRAYLAVLQDRYKIKVYAFKLMSNHYHLLVSFPEGQMVAFLRAFNAQLHRLVRRYIPEFRESRLCSQKPIKQVVGQDALEYYYFYVCLNAVSSGLTKREELFHNVDGFYAIQRGQVTYRYLDWASWKSALRFNPAAKKNNYIKEYILTYERLPTLQYISYTQYVGALEKLRLKWRRYFIAKNLDQGISYPSRYLKPRAGHVPLKTKCNKANEKIPLILTFDQKIKKTFLKWYVRIWNRYIWAADLYRSGIKDCSFPTGTYPPVCCIAH